MKGAAVKAAVAACLGAALQATAGGFTIGNEDRLVIYGDSITAGVSIPAYPRYVETYVRTRFPDWKGEAWNLGVVGDTAGNMRRYRAECLARKPTVITFNMGMNDVVHSNGRGFSRAVGRFLTNLTAIVTETRTNLPNARLILCSPEPYETRMVRGAAEKSVILRYASRRERDLARRLGVGFIDINGAYYRNYGISETFSIGMNLFTLDGVHYGPQGGHFLLAVAFLEGLGAEPHLAAATIDAASAAVRESRDVEIKDVRAAAGGLSFARRLKHLPFPAVNWQAAERQAWADRMMYGRYEIADRLNRDILTVTGLAAGAYSLNIDGRRYAVFAAEDFAEGVNLGEFCDSPDFERACALSDAVGRKQVAQRRVISLTGAKKKDAEKTAAAEKELAAALAAIPLVSHAEWHRIEITPWTGPFERWRDGQENVTVKFGKKEATDGWGWTQPLKAGADGWFRGEEDLSFFNCSDRERRVEAVMPEGFTPEAFVTVLPPRTSAVCRVAWKLPPDAGPRSVKIKHYRTDGLCTPLVQQVNFTYGRHARWRRGSDGSLAADFKLQLELPGEVARSLGPADCSATASAVWKDGRMTVDATALDQNHVNTFIDVGLEYDDSLSVTFGKKRYAIALSQEGPKLRAKEKDGVEYDVRREGVRTIYRLSFPCEKPSGDTPVSLIVFDREADQQFKQAVWSGVVGE